MFNIILVFTFFFLYLFFLKNKRGTWASPSIFLISIYFLSISCLIISLIKGNSREILSSDYLLPTLFFIVLCTLFFTPFTSFREDKIKKIVLPSRQTLDVISTILIILSFEAIFFFAGGVREVFAYGDLGAARNDRYIHDISFIQGGLMYTISSVSASLYMFDIMFFFIYLIIDRRNKTRLALLLIGSFSEVLHVLTDVGRDGIVFWIFAFVFIFLIFYPFLEKGVRKKIYKLFIIIALVISIPFMMISLGRFDDNVNDSFISYMGQPFKHFCYYFDIKPFPVNYGQAFTLYFEITHQPHPGYMEYGSMITHSSAFGTFFRDFIVNFGVLGSILVGIIIALVYLLLMKKSKSTMFFYQFFTYILYFQIFSQGVFYFRQYTRGGNLFIILCLIFSLLFQIRFYKGKPIVLYRVAD